MSFGELNDKLLDILIKEYPKMTDKVFKQPMCDIDGEFLGFVDTYYYLSQIIPKDWTVIDFGCAYNPQAYYFRQHKKFIAVDFGLKERFKFKNTKLIDNSIAEYLKTKPEKHKVFAICNNIPSSETKLVKNYYMDCFIFYTK